MGDHYADTLEERIGGYKSDVKKLSRKIMELEASLDYNITALDKADKKVMELAAQRAVQDAIIAEKTAEGDRYKLLYELADAGIPGNTCALCVHGHDLDITADTMIVCQPQGRAHDRYHSCTGFRRTTLKELGERADARFGQQRDV